MVDDVVELVAPLFVLLWLSRIAVPGTSSVTGSSPLAAAGRARAAAAAARKRNRLSIERLL